MNNHLLKREEFLDKQRFLNGKMKEQLNQKSIKYNWHEADLTLLEGLFARGDRRTGKVIEEAYELNEMMTGMDDLLLSLPEKGVEVSIFLYEKTVGYKASLRSNEYVNVSEVCLTFGGGGHIKAAGVTMNGTDKEIVSKLSDLICEQLKLLKA